MRLLTIFLLNPNATFHVRLLAARVGAQYSAVWKELKNLERIGLLVSQSSANTRTYAVNPKFPILPELRAVILKTVGAGDRVRAALTDMNHIDAAFVYGSFASGEMDQQSDIDLMMIGRIDLTKLAPPIAQLEKDLGRSVDYIASTAEEWHEKLHSGDPLIKNVIASPKTMLIGDEDAVRAIDRGWADQTLQSASRRNPPTAQGGRPRPRHRRTKLGR